MTVNKKLLEAIKSRQQKLTGFGNGISTADLYVKTAEQCVGNELCNRYACAKSANWQDILTKASETLVYSNEDMLADKKLTSLTNWKDTLSLQGVEAVNGLELPKNTLVLFTHTLTTPRKDRDGDRLRSEGAMLDPKMLLLWQHIPTLPIGKMLANIEHNKSRVRNLSAIIDMNDLCHDAAVMIDNDMGRYSHGFRALLFEALKDEDTKDGPNGYDITSYEIMEESLVSVPSNVDAETDEILLSLVEGGKLTSDFMKKRGELIREKRPVSVNITKNIEENKDEDKSRSGSTEKQAECECQGKCACTSKEAHEGTSKETTTTSDAQVKGRINGPIEGSWEDVSGKLRAQVRSYMENSRVVGLRDRYVWIVSTFPDRTIVCCEGYESGVADEYLYFKLLWGMEDGHPTFNGVPQAVEITTTVEITEKSPIFQKKNKSTCPDCGEQMDGDTCECGYSKSAKQEAAKVRDMPVDQAIGVIISHADKDDRARLKRYLEAVDTFDASNEVVELYRALITS